MHFLPLATTIEDWFLRGASTTTTKNHQRHCGGADCNADLGQPLKGIRLLGTESAARATLSASRMWESTSIVPLCRTEVEGETLHIRIDM